LGEIGKIKFIRRYPVKGMRGEDLEEASITVDGIPGDRRFAFVDINSPNPKFPWMTSRQAREFLLYEPRFLTESDIEIETPNGLRKYSLRDEEFLTLLEGKFGYELGLRFDKRGNYDSKPISIFSLDTLRQLETETSLALNHRRFRANLYTEWTNSKPFYENELIGKLIQIGEESKVKIVKKDSRCVVPTLNPDNSVSSPEILQVIQKNHRGCAGVYAVVIREGKVKLGDSIFLLEDSEGIRNGSQTN
jgi:uncharacterized protein